MVTRSLYSLCISYVVVLHFLLLGVCFWICKILGELNLHNFHPISLMAFIWVVYLFPCGFGDFKVIFDWKYSWMFKLVLLFSPQKMNVCSCEEYDQPGTTYVPLRTRFIWNLGSSLPTGLALELVSWPAVMLVFALTETWLLCLFAQVTCPGESSKVALSPWHSCCRHTCSCLSWI